MSDLFEGTKSQVPMYEYSIFTLVARNYLFVAAFVCVPCSKTETGPKRICVYIHPAVISYWSERTRF